MSEHIRDKYQGDALDVGHTETGIPTGDPVTRARMVIKRRLWDSDGQALVTKNIDTNNTASGQVTQTGGLGDGDGTALLLFHLLKEDTDLVQAETLHHYDIRIWLVSGNGYTIQRGTVIFKKRIAVATT